MREASNYCDLFERFYEKTSLQDDLNKISDSSEKVEDALLLNIVVKLFHEYVLEESISRVCSLNELAQCFYDFARDDIGGIAEQCEFGVQMLNDIWRTVALMRAIILQEVPDSVADNSVALDIGTGTGVLLIAQYISAMRNHIAKNIDFIGVDYDSATAERTNRLLQDLDIGRALRRDGTHPRMYAELVGEKNLAMFATETLPFVKQPIVQEPFMGIHSTMRKAIAKNQRENTVYFPEAIAGVYGCFRSSASILFQKDVSDRAIVIDDSDDFSLEENLHPRFFHATHLLLEDGFEHLMNIGEWVDHYSFSTEALFSERW